MGLYSVCVCVCVCVCVGGGGGGWGLYMDGFRCQYFGGPIHGGRVLLNNIHVFIGGRAQIYGKYIYANNVYKCAIVSLHTCYKYPVIVCLHTRNTNIQ